MAHILLVYTSMTGNTEEMADVIAEKIHREGSSTLVVQDIMEAEAADLEEYEGILLGSYTWCDGELPDEFLDFYDDMDELNLTGKVAAVFGSCDSFYPDSGTAVDTLIEKLQALGADVPLAGLKVDLTPSEHDKKDCETFAEQFVKIVNEAFIQR